MRGVLYIDNVDIYTSCGVSVSDLAYDDLVCFPELKPIAFNDWHEQNGIEPDLSEPVIDAKTITIPFYVSDVETGYNAFIDLISDGSYHIFNFAQIGLVKELRLVSSGELKSVRGLASFDLTFSDDEPQKGYVYEDPKSVIARLGDFKLDGIDFADYGIRMLNGTMDSIMQRPDVKENLKRNVSVSVGVKYDGEKVVYKSRTAQLRCLMRAENKEEFWNNRNALLYNLVKPGARTLTVSKLQKDIECFYKGCEVKCFFPDNGKYWFEFTLSLEFYKGVI